jgi:hypothetical protein
LAPDAAVRYRAMAAARLLAALDDVAAQAELLKLVQDRERFALVAAIADFDTWTLPTDGPGMIDALAARLKEASENKRLIWRSLGASHDPRAADVLIAALAQGKDEDFLDLARALASTRDPRALKTLTELAQSKRDWRDLESEMREALKKGKAMRMQVNPRKALMVALPETRDPALLKTLLAIEADPAVDAEVQQAARFDMIWAVRTAADMDALTAFVKQATPAAQRACLFGPMSSASQMMWMPLMGWPDHWPSDPRWQELLKQRALDDESWVLGGTVRYANHAANVLAGVMTPAAERTMVDLSQSDDPDLAQIAEKLLGNYLDPGLKGAPK